MNKKITYIDLFSGAGGFSLGFDSLGFENVFSIDKESLFCKTYKYNFPHHLLVEKDICDLTNDEIVALRGNKKVDVVLGGPPCQGFSIAGNIGRKFIDDPRNKLFKEFVRVVKIVKPAFFVLENVARLYTHNKGKTRQEIIKNFENLGYTVACQILNAADYGVPQVRKRVIFIGSLHQQNIIFPKKEVTKKITPTVHIQSFMQENNKFKQKLFKIKATLKCVLGKKFKQYLKFFQRLYHYQLYYLCRLVKIFLMAVDCPKIVLAAMECQKIR